LLPGARLHPRRFSQIGPLLKDRPPHTRRLKTKRAHPTHKPPKLCGGERAADERIEHQVDSLTTSLPQAAPLSTKGANRARLNALARQFVQNFLLNRQKGPIHTYTSLRTLAVGGTYPP